VRQSASGGPVSFGGPPGAILKEQMGSTKARGELLPADLERAARLLSLLQAQDESGALRYSDEDLRHFLPLVFLTLADSERELPPAVLELLGLFAAQAGLDGAESPAERARAIEAYYERHPVHPELLRAFQEFVRKELSTLEPERARAFEGFLGAPRKSAPLESGERPEGTLRAGPLLRFTSADDEE
jgi:hypothetical protein